MVALAAFVAAHALTSFPKARAPIEARIGKTGFYVLYSVLSLVLLGWVIAAAVAAPRIDVWQQQAWMRWAPILALPLACQLWVAGMSSPNPFSIGLGGAHFDLKRPGILRLTRHPILWGLSLWSGAHMLPNGHVAALLLFAPMLALALAGPRLLDAKRRKSLGEAEWARLAAVTGRVGDWRELASEVGPWRLASGLVLFAVLLALHPLVIGLSPLP